MKDLGKPFAAMVLIVLAVFTLGAYLIPRPFAKTVIDFKKEISGTLTEGNDENKTGSTEAGVGESGYNTLHAWGLSRGKSPGEIPRADPGAPELLSKYKGLYLGDTEKKIIYLTFDEGYENGYTGKILDVLQENGVKGLFFVTGPYLDTEEELIRRMVEEGHAVGNHTINHKSLPMISDDEIEREVTGLDRKFYDKYGKNMVFLRPPKGEYSPRSLDVTARLGYINVFWSFAYDDWAVNGQRGWEFAFNKVTKNLHNGAILLLHAVSSDNAAALDAIIKEARAQGYEFGDVHELEKLARGDGR